MATAITLYLLRKNNVVLCRNFSKKYSRLHSFERLRHGVWTNGPFKKWLNIPRRTKLTAVLREEAKLPHSSKKSKSKHMPVLFWLAYGLLTLISVTIIKYMDKAKKLETLWKKNCISWEDFVELYLSKGMVLTASIYYSFYDDDGSLNFLHKRKEIIFIELDQKQLQASLKNSAIPSHLKTKDGEKCDSFDENIEKVLVVVKMANNASFALRIQAYEKQGTIPPGQPIKVFILSNAYYLLNAMFLVCGVLFFYLITWMAGVINHTVVKKEALAISSLRKSLSDPYKAKMFTERQQVVLKDVGGLHDAKTELQKVVDYMKNPTKYMGFYASRNILVTGAAGCGKRSLIRAIAGECQVPLISELQILMHFLDVKESLESKEQTDIFWSNFKIEWPESFIIYLDVDSICRLLEAKSLTIDDYVKMHELWMNMISNANHYIQFGVHNDTDSDLQKDLFSKRIFNRLIKVEMPSYDERLEIAQMNMSKYVVTTTLPPNIVRTVAELTDGKSGADIATLCRQTSVKGDRLKLRPDDLTDFQYACERLNPGNPTLTGSAEAVNSPADLDEVITCHKLGHALVALHLRNTDFVPFFPKDVCSRLGFHGFFDHMDKTVPGCPRETFFDIVCHYVAGWVAEAVLYNTVTRGGLDALNKTKDFVLERLHDNQSLGAVQLSSNEKHDQHDMLYPWQQMIDKIREREAKHLVGQAFKQVEQILNSEREILQEMMKMSQNEPKNPSRDNERDRFEVLMSMLPYESDKGKSFFKRFRYEDKVIRDCTRLFVPIEQSKS